MNRLHHWKWTGYRLLFTAISMSLGWRIRGQFGHEAGAAIAGALGAMAVVLASGRDDWWRRIHYFALFGALGWAFGGSMSYMKVVAFTHSSDSATVLYGFASLFLIGFLWAALGAAGTALPAALDSVRLAGLFPAIVTVFAAWFLQSPAVDWYRGQGGTIPSWYDSDWLQAAVALAAALTLAIVRRRVDVGTSLVLHMTVGWWLGFLLLVQVLGWRLNPPRGDNWAGCIGLFGGVMVFCWRQRLAAVAYAALLTGTLGAAGFCLGQMLKLLGAFSQTFGGAHIVLEWLQGLFLGLALALGLALLVRRQRAHSIVPLPGWTGTCALFFVLWILPYLNGCRTPDRWMRDAGFPEAVQGIHMVGGFVSSHGWIGWLELLFLPLAMMLLLLLISHARRPLPFIPESGLGRGQLLYLVFLWAFGWMSFTIEISGLQPSWFVTQSAITLHVLLCTWLLLAGSMVPRATAPAETAPEWPIGRTLLANLLVILVTTFGGWSLKRGLFGDRFAGSFNANHVRFGPDNTNDKK